MRRFGEAPEVTEPPENQQFHTLEGMVQQCQARARQAISGPSDDDHPPTCTGAR